MSWNCLSCTFKNQEGDDECSICQQPRPRGQPAITAPPRGGSRPVQLVMWTCDFCGIRNSQYADFCQGCQKTRGTAQLHQYGPATGRVASQPASAVHYSTSSVVSSAMRRPGTARTLLDALKDQSRQIEQLKSTLEGVGLSLRDVYFQGTPTMGRELAINATVEHQGRPRLLSGEDTVVWYRCPRIGNDDADLVEDRVVCLGQRYEPTVDDIGHYLACKITVEAPPDVGGGTTVKIVRTSDPVMPDARLEDAVKNILVKRKNTKTWEVYLDRSAMADTFQVPRDKKVYVCVSPTQVSLQIGRGVLFTVLYEWSLADPEAHVPIKAAAGPTAAVLEAVERGQLYPIPLHFAAAGDRNIAVLLTRMYVARQFMTANPSAIAQYLCVQMAAVEAHIDCVSGLEGGRQKPLPSSGGSLALPSQQQQSEQLDCVDFLERNSAIAPRVASQLKSVLGLDHAGFHPAQGGVEVLGVVDASEDVYSHRTDFEPAPPQSDAIRAMLDNYVEPMLGVNMQEAVEAAKDAPPVSPVWIVPDDEDRDENPAQCTAELPNPASMVAPPNYEMAVAGGEAKDRENKDDEEGPENKEEPEQVAVESKESVESEESKLSQEEPESVPLDLGEGDVDGDIPVLGKYSDWIVTPAKLREAQKEFLKGNPSERGIPFSTAWEAFKVIEPSEEDLIARLAFYDRSKDGGFLSRAKFTVIYMLLRGLRDGLAAPGAGLPEELLEHWEEEV